MCQYLFHELVLLVWEARMSGNITHDLNLHQRALSRQAARTDRRHVSWSVTISCHRNHHTNHA